MERIAVYARVSKASQDLEHQLRQLRDYAARRGAEATEYVDRAGGSRASRPAYKAMLAAVRRREASAVVAVRLDRLARSVQQLCQLAADLEACGTALVVLEQSIDTSTSSGRFLFHTLAAVAELERDLIRERTREVRAPSTPGRSPGHAGCARRGEAIGTSARCSAYRAQRSCAPSGAPDTPQGGPGGEFSAWGMAWAAPRIARGRAPPRTRSHQGAPPKRGRAGGRIRCARAGMGTAPCLAAQCGRSSKIRHAECTQHPTGYGISI